MSESRARNLGAMADFMDMGLEQYESGGVSLEELTFEKKYRGEGRVLLKESQLKRLDSETMPGEDESHALLHRLMVSSDSLLARRHPLYHHDLTTNVFGSPAGYQRLLQMEKSSKPDTRERAANCRAGIERTLDMLEERGVELAIPRAPTPKWRDFQHTESAHAELFKRYDDHYRNAYNYLKDDKKAHAKAVNRVVEDLRYTPQHVRRMIKTRDAS